MAVSRLGWDLLEPSSSRLKSFPWITGKVREGDAFTVLNYLCERFNAEVETITKGHSWGYAKRGVRGATSIPSEHQTGCAIDLNAPKHGIGLRGTFSAGQVQTIHRILKDLDGVVRWGGDYAGRKDEMHFELQGGAKKLATVAAKISGKPTPSKPKPEPSKPSKPKGTAENKSIQTALKKMGLYKGVIDGVNGSMQKEAVKAYQKHHGLKVDGIWGKGTQAKFTQVKAVQKALISEGYTKQTIDGYDGAQTTANIKDYQKRVGLVSDGVAGTKTLSKLGVK